MQVIKFGGTSVGSVKGVQQIVAILRDMEQEGMTPVVVLSALGGVTNALSTLAESASRGEAFSDRLKTIESRHFDMAKALLPLKQQNVVFTHLTIMFNELEEILQGIASLKELSPQSHDLVLSFGERFSTFLICQIAKEHFPRVVCMEATSFISTDSNFGHAAVDMKETAINIQNKLGENPDHIRIVTGFIGADSRGRVTTLGRGGSDYTAAIIGAVLEATSIEIWTDVDGMLTADPRRVRKAFPLSDLSYTEAMELSYFGAKVIYPPTMLPAFEKNIPIVIRNTFNREFTGTVIQRYSDSFEHPIKGISSIDEVSIINLSGSGMIGKSGFSGKLFGLMSRENINIILITQSSSEHSITFAVHPEDALRAVDLIKAEFELELLARKLNIPTVEDRHAVIAIVGENMKRTPGMSGRLFNALGRNGVNVRAIAQGSSEYNISVIVDQKDLSKSLNAVHDAFFAERRKTLHVFCVGTGNIGGTLFSQIRKQAKFLETNNELEIKVVGIANTRQMLICEEGIDLENWNEALASGKQADLDRFIQLMKAMNLSNCIFVDNTASSLIPERYVDIFEANISIVTSNKIANSGTYKQYQRLKNTAFRHGVDFFYETNVGAGLPIIRTLKDLMMSGDRVLKIEAILSGTISYIFNHYNKDRRLVDVVKEAYDLGYTEPDPRDDLNGKDFMRKLLILARESGLPLEEEEVSLEAILPEACMLAPNVEAFFEALEASEPHFNRLKEQASKDNLRIRYVGVLEQGKAEIKLELVDAQHPFFSLSGSDNIISFTTERYKERPLVVKGPGAGAEVTAAGVFAEIVNTSR